MTHCFTVQHAAHKDWTWSRCWTVPSILRWKSVNWCKSGRETCVPKFAASGCWKWCELIVCLLLLITCSGKQLLAIAMLPVCKLWYSEMTPFVILRVVYSSFLPMLLFMCIILTLLVPIFIFLSLNALWYVTVLRILIDIINIILTRIILKYACMCVCVYLCACMYVYFP